MQNTKDALYHTDIQYTIAVPQYLEIKGDIFYDQYPKVNLI